MSLVSDASALRWVAGLGLSLSALGAAGCGNASPTTPQPRVGVATVVEQWGRMSNITACDATTMTGYLELGIKTREINGGPIAYTSYFWALIQRPGSPTEVRETGSGTFSGREVVPYGEWQGWVAGENVTIDYDTTYELTVNSVATTTGAMTPLFVTGKVTQDGCTPPAEGALAGSRTPSQEGSNLQRLPVRLDLAGLHVDHDVVKEFE